MPTHRRRAPEKIRIGLLLFFAVCMIAIGWRVFKPILWPKIHPETPKQTSSRMLDDNTLYK